MVHVAMQCQHSYTHVGVIIGLICFWWNILHILATRHSSYSEFTYLCERFEINCAHSRVYSDKGSIIPHLLGFIVCGKQFLWALSKNPSLYIGMLHYIVYPNDLYLESRQRNDKVITPTRVKSLLVAIIVSIAWIPLQLLSCDTRFPTPGTRFNFFHNAYFYSLTWLSAARVHCCRFCS